MLLRLFVAVVIDVDFAAAVADFLTLFVCHTHTPLPPLPLPPCWFVFCFDFLCSALSCPVLPLAMPCPALLWPALSALLYLLRGVSGVESGGRGVGEQLRAAAPPGKRAQAAAPARATAAGVCVFFFLFVLFCFLLSILTFDFDYDVWHFFQFYRGGVGSVRHGSFLRSSTLSPNCVNGAFSLGQSGTGMP